MTLDTMTPQERKRQGYIHELIQTEEIYMDDLELVLEVQMSTQARLKKKQQKKTFRFKGPVWGKQDI